MYEVPRNARLEIKFAAYRVQLDRILTWIRSHDAAFFSPFPDRRVNNVYFDTHEATAYVQNLAGSSTRVKVRYRWYGDSLVPAPGSLEIKHKRNYFGWKTRYKAENLADIDRGDDWLGVRRKLLNAMPPAGRIWTPSASPSSRTDASTAVARRSRMA